MAKGIDKGIIECLLWSYPKPLTLSQIADITRDAKGQRIGSASAVDYHLNNAQQSLQIKGYVLRKEDTYVLRGKEDTLRDHKELRSIDLMLEFFFPNGGSLDESYVHFLASPYAREEVFSGLALNALIYKAHFKWMALMGPQVLDDLALHLSRSHDQTTINLGRFYHDVATGLRNGSSLEAINSALREKYPELKPTDKDRGRDFCLTQWFRERDWKRLKGAIHFAPSLVRYVDTDDVGQGTPLLLFDTTWLEKIAGKSKKEAERAILDGLNKAFRMFWWRLVASFVAHDLAMFRVLSDESLIESGREDLEFVLVKAFTR